MSEASTPDTQTTQLNDQLRHADQVMNAGNFAEAEVVFKQYLTHAPKSNAVLHKLGYVLYRSGKMKEAEEILLQATQGPTLSGTLMLLARIFEESRRQTEAVRCYKVILKGSPGNHGAAVKLADLLDRMGDKSGAREYYRIAMETKPTDPVATSKYTAAIWDSDPERALILTEKLLAAVGHDLNARAEVLSTLICQKEWWERIKRGLMPYHASHIDELFFNYANHYVEDYDTTNRARIAADPKNTHAVIGLGLARFCLHDRHLAETYFKSAPERIKGHIFEAVRFSPDFYDELRMFRREDLVAKLPPRQELTPPVPDDKGVLYLSSNFVYFQAFALPMLCSLRERSPGTPVHIHIMDANEAEISFAMEACKKLTPLRFALSVEYPGLRGGDQTEARCYYHAVRFIRFYEHLNLYKCPLWLMDVDAVVNRDLEDLFGSLGDADVAMRIRPGRLEPWNQFNACIVGARPTPASMEYFRLIAAYVAYFYRNKSLKWGIDQLAMYGVFADLQDRGEAPHLALLGEKQVDYKYQDDGFIWCNSGAIKFRHLQRISNPQSMPFTDFGENRFVGAFENYWHKTQHIAAELGVEF